MTKEFYEFANNYKQDLEAALKDLDLESLRKASQLIKNCKGLVWLAGNGGSAALASHMATDLQLAGVRAQALTDVAAITTYANDISYTDSITEQMKYLVRPGDLMILISTSGNSDNIWLSSRTSILQ